MASGIRWSLPAACCLRPAPSPCYVDGSLAGQFTGPAGPFEVPPTLYPRQLDRQRDLLPRLARLPHGLRRLPCRRMPCSTSTRANCPLTWATRPTPPPAWSAGATTIGLPLGQDRPGAPTRSRRGAALRPAPASSSPWTADPPISTIGLTDGQYLKAPANGGSADADHRRLGQRWQRGGRGLGRSRGQRRDRPGQRRRNLGAPDQAARGRHHRPQRRRRRPGQPRSERAAR